MELTLQDRVEPTDDLLGATTSQERSDCETLGIKELEIYAGVPPNQSRDFEEEWIFFPKVNRCRGQRGQKYDVKYIQGELLK